MKWSRIQNCLDEMVPYTELLDEKDAAERFVTLGIIPTFNCHIPYSFINIFQIITFIARRVDLFLLKAAVGGG